MNSGFVGLSRTGSGNGVITSSGSASNSVSALALSDVLHRMRVIIDGFDLVDFGEEIGIRACLGSNLSGYKKRQQR